jgi:Glutathione S-transferase, N-terminal domain
LHTGARKAEVTIIITVFERSPDGGKGLARDMRVRWALEEVGQAYAVRLVSFRAMKEPAHRALHPFGQIPTYEEGGRGEARPAYKRAFAAQLAVNTGRPATG